MSDSFADLWNSTAPSKPAEAPRKLGSLSPSPALGAQQRKTQNDVFSLLASAGSSSNSRSTTPSYTAQISTQPMQKSISIGGQAARASPQPVQKSSSQAGDAFGDLLAGTFSSTGGANKSNMTIAERAAQAEQQRLQKQLINKHATNSQRSSVWAGLDSLGSSSNGGGKSASVSVSQAKGDDDWGFAFETPNPAPVPASKKPLQPDPAAEDDWGLNDFTSRPTSKATPIAKTTSSQAPSGSLWDLDEFTSPPAQSTTRASPAPALPNRTDTPGSFDFGDREDGLLDGGSDNEDDILGALAKPARKRLNPPKDTTASSPAPRPSASEKPSRSVSPPPHILGQIVEMGFSVQQARVALASTDTGLDVQAALETLLSNGAGSRSSPAPAEQPRSRQQRQEHLSDEEPAPRSRGLPRRNREREPPARENASPADGDTQRNLQDQADKLLAQASEIGLNMFSRANALWNQGKQKVQQVYEERAAVPISKPAGVRKDNRPKWMQNEEDEGMDGDGWGQPSNGSGFKDSDDEHEGTAQAFAAKEPARRKVPLASPPQQPQDPSSRLRTGDLIGGENQSVYVSPFRRKATSRSQTTTPSKPVPNSAPAPIQLLQRNTISASAPAIASSASHKVAGTEMFKLGRYAEAETSYSSAISALPDAHLLLVPLYNNRALARIKTGDHSGAVEDCTTVIRLIGTSYHPAREAKVTKEDEGSSVDLADALIKALRRRAEAYEGKEKWEEARKDWEAIAGREWAGKSRNEAAQAAGRCRRMLTQSLDTPAPATAAATPKPKPKVAPKPFIPRVPTPTEALNRVREANQAAEAEDQEKFVLKDTVDTRLQAWKGGKENNIRALIASLDTVLWPELGWQKVGMHELVTPSQVKIRYTKAIAKLHPDKLNVNNTTLEQRMIANGVFGSLNDAWNAFKQ